MRGSLPFLILLFFAVGCFWANGSSPEEKAALHQLAVKADAGEPKALYDLARLHDIGYDTIAVDSLRSTALYLLSARKGYAPAMNYIGFKYYNGFMGKRDVDSAFYWIRKAADQGDVTAAANLGYLLMEGKDVNHDEEEALKWISVAAENGVPEAQFKLVDLMVDQWEELPVDSALLKGEEFYLGKAPIIGVRLLEIASDKGSAKALALLGDAYSKGVGVPYDHQKSTEYFYKAALACNPSAQFIVAELLEIFPDAIPGAEGAEFWLDKARIGGVEDSESAYRLLYSIP